MDCTGVLATFPCLNLIKEMGFVREGEEKQKVRSKEDGTVQNNEFRNSKSRRRRLRRQKTRQEKRRARKVIRTSATRVVT